MRRAIVLFLMSLFLFSCESEQVKPPSEDSEIARQAFKVIDSIRELYVRKDFDAMAEFFTKESYMEFKRALRLWDSAELIFTPRLVEIENDKVTLNVSWQGKWIFIGRTYSERGMAIFELEGSPLKVTGILSGSPFIYPVESR